MRVRDIMTQPVFTVRSTDPIEGAAALLAHRRITAAPVVDGDGRLIGMVSEGDLLRRAEAGTEQRRPWWLLGLTRDETLAEDYVKAHTRRVEDVMIRRVVTAAPDTPLHEVATLLEKSAIKRVPIVENGELVGIVSRANLIQAIASARKALDIRFTDSAIRDKLLAHLKHQAWAHTSTLNITVTDGVVDLWGLTDSDAERKAIRVAAETAQGVNAVNDNLVTHAMRGGY